MEVVRNYIEKTAAASVLLGVVGGGVVAGVIVALLAQDLFERVVQEVVDSLEVVRVLAVGGVFGVVRGAWGGSAADGVLKRPPVRVESLGGLVAKGVGDGLEQGDLGGVGRAHRLDVEDDLEGAAVGAHVADGDTLARDVDGAAGLGAGGDAQLDLGAVKGGHLDGSAQRSSGHRDLRLVDQVLAVPLEVWVRLHPYADDQVAVRQLVPAGRGHVWGVAGVGDPDPRAVLDSRGKPHLGLLDLRLHALAVAAPALVLVVDLHTGPVARLARRRHVEPALQHVHLGPRSVTHLTGGLLLATLQPAAVARVTLDNGTVVDLHPRPEDRLLERNCL